MGSLPRETAPLPCSRWFSPFLGVDSWVALGSLILEGARVRPPIINSHVFQNKKLKNVKEANNLHAVYEGRIKGACTLLGFHPKKGGVGESLQS